MRKKYIFLFVVMLFFFFLCLILDTNALQACYHYLTNNTYRKQILFSYQTSSFSSFFLLFKDWILNYDWKFDSIMVWATNMFQLIVPVLAIFCCIIYSEKINNATKKGIYIYSLKIALLVFLSYITFYFLILFFTGGELGNTVTREVFLDILGKSFYQKYVYIYYLLEGFVKIFISTFIYVSLCIFFFYLFSNKVLYYYYFLLSYSFMCIFTGICERQIHEVFLYFNPTTLMATGSYENISTILTLGIPFTFLKISSIFFERGVKKC